MKAANVRSRPRSTTAVIIGGGQAGLATSYELSRRGIAHVVLERGEVANSWRRERWDSLRLLTPNWQASLTGFPWSGGDPDGFMSAGEVCTFLHAYANFSAAPLLIETCVTSVTPADNGYLVQTNRGDWRCHALVVASGPYNIPRVPAIASALPEQITQLTPYQYRNPEQLESGAVLVVGASATGVQIAREVQRSGRQVTLAVGEHVRLPRTYRGRDIQYWMHVTGLLDDGYQDIDDIARVRNLPSPQLLGHQKHTDVGLNALASQGVNLVGRLVGVQGRTVQFSGALANVVKLADLKQARLLRSIDAWIGKNGGDDRQASIETPTPTQVPAPSRLNIDLHADRITTVIWATGFRPDYSWLHVPVVDRKGYLLHDGGVTSAPGLYAMGLPFMRKRKSALLFGAADDAKFIAHQVCRHVHDRYRSLTVGATGASTRLSEDAFPSAAAGTGVRPSRAPAYAAVS